MPSEAVITRGECDELFRQIDADGDGELTQQEIKKGVRHHSSDLLGDFRQRFSVLGHDAFPVYLGLLLLCRMFCFLFLSELPVCAFFHLLQELLLWVAPGD